MEDLVNASYLEQLFYMRSKEQYWKDQGEFYRAINGLGGDE